MSRDARQQIGLYALRQTTTARVVHCPVEHFVRLGNCIRKEQALHAAFKRRPHGALVRLLTHARKRRHRQQVGQHAALRTSAARRQQLLFNISLQIGKGNSCAEGRERSSGRFRVGVRQNGFHTNYDET
eukprot:scaffold10596_cov75-Phaeocystis_antarctica.AAC.3